MSPRRALALWWVGLTTIGLLLGQWIVHSSIDSWVVIVDDAVRQHIRRRPRLVHVADLVSGFGTQQLVVAGAVVLTVLVWRRRRPLTWAPLVIYVGANGSTAIVKLVTDRPGPPHRFWTSSAAWYDSAFPSGHATAAAALFVGAALLLTTGRDEQMRPTRLLRWVALAAALVLSIGVGVARLLIDVHWFSDVAAGLVLGTAWAALTVRAWSTTERPAPAPELEPVVPSA